MRTLLVAMMALGAVGCGDDGSSTPMDGGMTGSDAGTDGGPMPDARRPDSGPTGDGNDDFDEAAMLEIGGMTPGMGALDPMDDSDYFRFDGTMGQWVAISTTANPDDDPAMVDTVITLFDAAMNQIAENDDAFPRISVDSEIITRLPADGVYYIQVQEFSSWIPDDDVPPEGDPAYTYEVEVFELFDMAAAVTMDTETGDDVASAIEATLSSDFGLVLGTFEDATDIDVYTVNVATGTRNLTSYVMPNGTLGYGSTADARVWLTNEAGDTIIGRIDQSADFSELAPSVEPGMYRIFVEHVGATTAENDFYVLKVVSGMDNPAEAMDLTNGVVATPEVIPMTARMDMSGESGFILAHLGMADTDYFSFAVPADRTITIACGSASNGSGVMGLQVALSGPMDEPINMRTEMPPMDLLIQDAMPIGEGMHLLRLTKTGQDAEVTGDWVRCGIHTNRPMM